MEMVPSGQANGTTLVGNTLSGATIVNSTISGSTIVASTSSGSTIVASTLTGATILASTLSGATIVNSTINSGSTVSVYALPAQQYVSVHRNGVLQAITGSTYTKILHTTEEFDASGVFDSATNYRMTPTVAGKYLATSVVTYSGSSGGFVESAIYKNGARYKSARERTDVAGDISSSITAVIDMNGSTDYLEHFTWQNLNTTANLSGGSTDTYFQAMWMSQ